MNEKTYINYLTMPIAANLINGKTYENKKGDKIENITIGGDKDNAYCYTFAAPNTFYIPDNKYIEQITLERKYEGEWREPKGNKYRCIFNIVNDDDFVPKVPMEECGWTKYGQEARISIEKDLTHNYIMDLARGYNYNPSEIHSGLTIVKNFRDGDKSCNKRDR